MFSIFFVGCLTCLGMSAWYHTVSNHSHEAARMWNVMDYVGIVGLIAGSCIPSLYYGFLCENGLRWAYWGMVSFAFPDILTLIDINPHQTLTPRVCSVV